MYFESIKIYNEISFSIEEFDGGNSIFASASE